MKEKRCKTVRGTIYYWTSEAWQRERETIFFFPGLTADHTMYDQQMEYFEGKYNLIVWDAPGHGKSRPYSEFSFQNTSEDILQILQKEKVTSVHMVGQSLGGYYIQAFIYRHPAMVTSFIGIGTTPYGEGYYSKWDKWWLRQVEWMSMLCPMKWMKQAAAKQATTTKYGYQNMISMLEPYSKKEYCHLMGTAYKAFLEDNREIHIGCPVFIMYGEQDRVGKVRKYCKSWTKRMGYPLKVIPNAGHNANVDNPEEVNKWIEVVLQTKHEIGG